MDRQQRGEHRRVGRSGDIEDVFALLHLYHTEPRVGKAGLRRAAADAAADLAVAASRGPWVVHAAYIEARHPGNPWYRLLASEEQIESAAPESLLDLYRRRFGGVDDLTVIVVGDTTADVVADLAARYVGTLPEGEADVHIDRRSPHPSGVTRVEVPLEDSSGVGVTLHYEIPVEFTPDLVVAVDVLEEVLREQVFRRARQQLAGSYDTEVSIDVEPTPEFTVKSRLAASGPPELLERIHGQILAVAEDMAANGPTPSDLEQAKKITADEYTTADHNLDLMNLALLRQHLPDADLPTPARRAQALQALTVADVRALAAMLYTPGRRIEVFGIPTP